jgi:hypothetical protein
VPAIGRNKKTTRDQSAVGTKYGMGWLPVVVCTRIFRIMGFKDEFFASLASERPTVYRNSI